MSKRTKHLILACVVPVLILLGMCVTPLYTLYKGEDIILSTIPIDPSDVFRGDYVTLKYQAEEVPSNLVEKDVKNILNNGRSGVRVYVPLENKGGVYTPIKVTLEKPKKGIYLKGKLEYIGPNMEEKEVAYIKYSLDKYFVEDNTGTKWEQASTNGKLLAKVKVHNGYAILTDIKLK